MVSIPAQLFLPEPEPPPLHRPRRLPANCRPWSPQPPPNLVYGACDGHHGFCVCCLTCGCHRDCRLVCRPAAPVQVCFADSNAHWHPYFFSCLPRLSQCRSWHACSTISSSVAHRDCHRGAALRFFAGVFVRPAFDCRFCLEPFSGRYAGFDFSSFSSPTSHRKSQTTSPRNRVPFSWVSCVAVRE